VGREPIFFVADAHLRAGDRDGASRLADFVESLPPGRLFFLGDLFNLYWGPEAVEEGAWERLFSVLKARGRELRAFFLPGNRDFLVGRELRLRSGIELLGEFVSLKRGALRLLACHGDQLCLEDLSYQRLKRVIRDPLLLSLWRAFPRWFRRAGALALRRASLRRLRHKDSRVLQPTGRVLNRIFATGFKAVLSGHRHLWRITRYPEGLHIELPAWEETGFFIVWREDGLLPCRYEKKGKIWESRPIMEDESGALRSQ